MSPRQRLRNRRLAETSELHDARARARRVVTVARALVAMPPQSKENYDG
jgi:hypothetical protein